MLVNIGSFIVSVCVSVCAFECVCVGLSFTVCNVLDPFRLFIACCLCA